MTLLIPFCSIKTTLKYLALCWMNIFMRIFRLRAIIQKWCDRFFSARFFLASLFHFCCCFLSPCHRFLALKVNVPSILTIPLSFLAYFSSETINYGCRKKKKYSNAYRVSVWEDPFFLYRGNAHLKGAHLFAT